MDKKGLIRRKYFLKRKKNYLEIKNIFFNPLIKLLKNKNIKNISLYYPSFYELNIFKILELKYFKKFNFLLPVIKENYSMTFCRWRQNDVLLVNKYGIPEPLKLKNKIPDLMLVPMLAYDKNKNRLGYGKGFYDRYLKKYVKSPKKIVTVGVAFSFQKHHNLPINKNDIKLDYVMTEKGLIR
tara:strand:- start:845 stop:1390 length:546 start_codon:yes stop_codon:yes gene_type:complete